MTKATPNDGFAKQRPRLGWALSISLVATALTGWACGGGKSGAAPPATSPHLPAAPEPSRTVYIARNLGVDPKYTNEKRRFIVCDAAYSPCDGDNDMLCLDKWTEPQPDDLNEKTVHLLNEDWIKLNVKEKHLVDGPLKDSASKYTDDILVLGLQVCHATEDYDQRADIVGRNAYCRALSSTSDMNGVANEGCTWRRLTFALCRNGMDKRKRSGWSLRFSHGIANPGALDPQLLKRLGAGSPANDAGTPNALGGDANSVLLVFKGIAVTEGSDAWNGPHRLGPAPEDMCTEPQVPNPRAKEPKQPAMVNVHVWAAARLEWALDPRRPTTTATQSTPP